MKIISSKILAAMLVVLMLCMLLPSAALAEGETITLKKYEKESYITITLNAETQGIPAGTYYAAPANSIAIVKQAKFAIVFGATEQTMTDDLRQAINRADSSISASGSTIHYAGSNTSFTINPTTNGGTYYFGYTDDNGVKYVLAPQSKVSHFVTDVTDSSTTTTPEPTPEPDPTPSNPSEKKSEPSMDKDISADGEEYKEDSLDNAVKPGDTVYFKLTSNLPEALENAIEEAADGTKTMKAGQTLTFTDTMTSNLTRNSDLKVYIGDSEVTNDSTTSYYTITEKTDSDTDSDTNTETNSFTVTLDLTALYNAGKITDADIGIADKVTVTYSATVSENAQNEEGFKNEAYATYNETPSVTSTVTGKVETEEPDTPPDTPPTGGAGTTLFTVGGLGLMAVAGTLLLRRRQDA